MSAEKQIIDITVEWLESQGFTVEHDGDYSDGAWRGSFCATSQRNHDGVSLEYQHPEMSWRLEHSNNVWGRIPLPGYDDGNDILELADLLCIPMSASPEACSE